MNNQEKINQLKELLSHEGWKIVVENLEANIQHAQDKLNGDEKMEENETYEIVQAKRRDRIALRDLPQILINELEEPKNEDDELDPYEKTIVDT